MGDSKELHVGTGGRRQESKTSSSGECSMHYPCRFSKVNESVEDPDKRGARGPVAMNDGAPLRHCVESPPQGTSCGRHRRRPTWRGATRGSRTNRVVRGQAASDTIDARQYLPRARSKRSAVSHSRSSIGPSLAYAMVSVPRQRQGHSRATVSAARSRSRSRLSRRNTARAQPMVRPGARWVPSWGVEAVWRRSSPP